MTQSTAQLFWDSLAYLGIYGVAILLMVAASVAIKFIEDKEDKK